MTTPQVPSSTPHCGSRFSTPERVALWAAFMISTTLLACGIIGLVSIASPAKLPPEWQVAAKLKELKIRGIACTVPGGAGLLAFTLYLIVRSRQPLRSSSQQPRQSQPKSPAPAPEPRPIPQPLPPAKLTPLGKTHLEEAIARGDTEEVTKTLNTITLTAEEQCHFLEKALTAPEKTQYSIGSRFLTKESVAAAARLGHPLLPQAIRSASLLVTSLLDKGADPQGADATGRSPLLIAIEEDATSGVYVLDKLLATGIEPTEQEWKAMLAQEEAKPESYLHVKKALAGHLEKAIREKDTAKIERLHFFFNQMTPDQITLAIENGAVAPLKYHLDRRSLREDEEQTILLSEQVSELHPLVKNLHAIDELIHKKGALKTPLEETRFTQEQLNHWLLRISKSPSKNGKLKTLVNSLIERGAEINTRDQTGNTPLHHAAYSNNALLAQHFLNKNADRTIKNNSGFTPAQVTSQLQHLLAL